MRLEGTKQGSELGEGTAGLSRINDSGRLEAGAVVIQSAFGKTPLAAPYRGAHSGTAPRPRGPCRGGACHPHLAVTS